MHYNSSSWTGRDTGNGRSIATGRAVVLRRRWVRWLLLGNMVVAAAMTVVQIASGTTAALLPDGVGLFAILLFCGHGSSPFAQSSFSPPDKGGLDEFERSTVEWATLASYRGIMALIMACCAYGWIATYRAWPLLDQPSDWAALGMGLVVVASNLPACVAEFAIPMPADAVEDTP